MSFRMDVFFSDLNALVKEMSDERVISNRRPHASHMRSLPQKLHQSIALSGDSHKLGRFKSRFGYGG